MLTFSTLRTGLFSPRAHLSLVYIYTRKQTTITLEKVAAIYAFFIYINDVTIILKRIHFANKMRGVLKTPSFTLHFSTAGGWYHV